MKAYTSHICSLLILCAGSILSAKPKSPNVILVVADDLGYGGLHCYGNEWLETPNIDTLSSQGMRFTNGHSAGATCQPSRIALLSGQYSPRTGGYRVKDHHRGQENLIRYQVPELTGMSLEKVTIAEAFKAGGYRTAMYGKWHADNYQKHLHPRYQGFDEAYECNSHYDAKKSDPKVDLPKGMDFAEYFTGKAIDFMQASVEQEQPFFLYMPYYLVHAPFETRADYIEHFQQKLADHEFTGKKSEIVPIVAAMTKHLDDCVGRLMESVSALGIDDNTLIVFTSDNGSYHEAFVGDYRGTKGDIYEGGIRVPYIFKWSGRIEAGSQSEALITHVDLYPTFLDMVGVARPEDTVLDGINLESVLLGEVDALTERSVYYYYPKYAQFNKNKKQWQQSWRNVVINGGYKLVEFVEYDTYELYNLKADPNESKDLSKTQPEKAEQLRKELDGWKGQVGAQPLVLNPNYTLE